MKLPKSKLPYLFNIKSINCFSPVCVFSANGMTDPAGSSVGSATSPKLEPPPSPHANRKKHRRKKSTGITKPDGLSAGNEGTAQSQCYSFNMTTTSETERTSSMRCHTSGKTFTFQWVHFHPPVLCIFSTSTEASAALKRLKIAENIRSVWISEVAVRFLKQYMKQREMPYLHYVFSTLFMMWFMEAISLRPFLL